VVVRWRVEGGGLAEPDAGTTDAGGFVETWWTLGDAPAVQRIRAEAEGAEPAVARALFLTDPPPVDGPPVALPFVTFDGSGQVVHPDWTRTPAAWSPAGQLVLTPYPNGNANLELPSEFAGAAIDLWQVPDGVENPIVRPRGSGYLSDPDHLWLADRGELWLYYREVEASNTILLTRSRDGVSWTTPVEVAKGANHTIVSPAVVQRRTGEWLMWAVNSGFAGCGAGATSVELRRSSDGVSWSGATPVQLEQPGYSVWHIEVQWLPGPGEYWALYNVKTPGGCLTPALYLATSRDGVAWRTFPSPVLARGAIPELEHTVYRSTFAYDELSDVVTFWYSGASYVGGRWVWRGAVQQVGRAELFRRIASAPLSIVGPPADVPAWEQWP
jgi:hypothetical protein